MKYLKKYRIFESASDVVNDINDIFIDLEHNNDLFLESYSSFYLYDQLEFKQECKKEDIFKRASEEVRKICKKYRF
jgi:hypothetical protein